jgi:hypothetical protein
MSSNKNFNPLPESEWRKSAQSENVGSTGLKATPKIAESHEKPVDHRPFIVRLLSSIRLSPKINLKGLHGVQVKGGTDF